jgi:hypothetical protein
VRLQMRSRAGAVLCYLRAVPHTSASHGFDSYGGAFASAFTDLESTDGSFVALLIMVRPARSGARRKYLSL